MIRGGGDCIIIEMRAPMDSLLLSAFASKPCFPNASLLTINIVPPRNKYGNFSAFLQLGESILLLMNYGYFIIFSY